MKKLFLVCLSVLTLIFASVFTSATPAFATVNDFYFKSATFDYYLEKAENGASHMRVVEVLTAVFPEDIDQNHGIERLIPTTYQGVNTLNVSSFSVTRNGVAEKFTEQSKSGIATFRIGDANLYVRGEQVYRISYEFDNVILQPNDSNFQELYWDTNGTAWQQKFNSLTATVHLSDELLSAFTGMTSCYVGRYGSYGPTAMSRCKTDIDVDSKTITFSTEDLIAMENLTLDLAFYPETFYVKKDLKPYIIGTAIGASIIAIIAKAISNKKKAKARNAEKIALAESPKPVQYTPYPGLTVAQAKKIWIDAPYLDSKVASLMELAVNHRIELEKGEKESRFLKIKSNAWKIHVKNLAGASREQVIVLEILNGGKSVKDGDTIEIQNQSYSSKVHTLSTSYTTTVETDLRNKHLLEQSANVEHRAFTSSYNKYETRTMEGIKVSNYIDGLKEYVELAEADRIKFLHSVKGADVSHQGIVKLYEKLLPYAIIFKCEDSWLAELNKYYEFPDVEEPDWLATGLILSSSDFRSFETSTTSSVSSATISSDSGGSSGGGGGGFSGGGGGGGGGGGW